LITFYVGRRTLDDCRHLISDLAAKLNSKPLFVSDELPHYKEALENQYGTYVEQPRTGKRGRPQKPKLIVDPELKYATVHKTRENGKIVKVERRILYGNESTIEDILSSSMVSKTINTAFLERTNLSLRAHNGRLTRKTLSFSKEKSYLSASTAITSVYYNFSLPHGGLTLKDENGNKTKRTPAIAANLIERVWPLEEILKYPMQINNN